MTKWIKDGDIVDPVNGTVERGDLLVEKGKIAAIKPEGILNDPGPDVMVIDAAGKLVIPGLVDMHVHLSNIRRQHRNHLRSG